MAASRQDWIFKNHSQFSTLLRVTITRRSNEAFFDAIWNSIESTPRGLLNNNVNHLLVIIAASCITEPSSHFCALFVVCQGNYCYCRLTNQTFSQMRNEAQRILGNFSWKPPSRTCLTLNSRPSFHNLPNAWLQSSNNKRQTLLHVDAAAASTNGRPFSFDEKKELDDRKDLSSVQTRPGFEWHL